jgi:hypothetical protein
MGSLIAALNNQNISAANAETLGDVYAANPANSGYTDNPFGYAASPAVIQTAYPKYGYNATAPQVPQSYEDYDLTSLFGMLEKMKGATGAAGTTLTQSQLDALNALIENQNASVGGPTPDEIIGQPYLANQPTASVTPGGILAAAGKVQTGVQPAGPPVPGAYTVPGSPTAPADTTAEDQAAAQAAEDARIRSMIAEDAAARQKAELISRYRDVVDGTGGFNPDPDISRFPNAEIKRQTAEIARGIEQMQSQE